MNDTSPEGQANGNGEDAGAAAPATIEDAVLGAEVEFAAPALMNNRVLVRRDPNMVANEPDVDRKDVWAKFQDGMCITRDKEVIAWLKAHSTSSEESHALYHVEMDQVERATNCPHFAICRSVDDPNYNAWVDLEQRKQATPSEEAQLPKDFSLERLLAGQSPSQHRPGVK